MEKDKSKLWFGTFKVSISLLLATVILAAIYFYFLFSNLSYKSGLAGNPFYYMNWIPFFLLLCLIGFFVLIMALVNTIAIAINLIKQRRSELTKLLLAAAPLLIFVIFLIPEPLSPEPGAVYFLRGHEVWVENNVDIQAIRNWLMSLPSEYSEANYFEATDFPEKLPEVITKLDPYHMYLSKFKDGQRCVDFEWGSAFGHFGIRIGSPEMEIPEQEECIILSETEYEYRRSIEPGVYIYDRG